MAELMVESKVDNSDWLTAVLMVVMSVESSILQWDAKMAVR